MGCFYNGRLGSISEVPPNLGFPVTNSLVQCNSLELEAGFNVSEHWHFKQNRF